jgi:hypothetical protein
MDQLTSSMGERCRQRRRSGITVHAPTSQTLGMVRERSNLPVNAVRQAGRRFGPSAPAPPTSNDVIPGTGLRFRLLQNVRTGPIRASAHSQGYVALHANRRTEEAGTADRDGELI